MLVDIVYQGICFDQLNAGSVGLQEMISACSNRKLEHGRFMAVASSVVACVCAWLFPPTTVETHMCLTELELPNQHAQYQEH